MNPRNFFAELRRRNVIRMAGLYLVGAWLLIQVASTVLPTFDVPSWALRGLIITLALGFIPALIFSWVFELTPQGLKRDAEVTPEQSIAPQTARRMDRMIIAVLVLALGYFGFDKFVLAPRREAALVATTAQSHPALAPNESPSPVNAKSIAVLPFENLSSDKENAYFADGIQDEILTHLSKVAALKVISRTSTQKYKSAPDNLREVGKQLGVANLLEGSVQKIANAVHVNVQLIRVATDEHLWAESYNRKLDDIFGVEGEVAGAIAEQLNAKLSGTEKQELAARPTNNPEAYDAYLRGLALSERPDLQNVDQLSAIQAFEAAVHLDSGFALAWAALSYVQAGLFFNSDASTARREAAHTALDNALRLQPDLLETQVAEAYYHYLVERDYDRARQIFEQIRRKAPNNSEAPLALALIARRQGRWEESLARSDEAIKLDPRNLRALIWTSGTYIALRQFPAALKLIDRVLDIAPADSGAIALKAGIYQGMGELDRADAVLAKMHTDPGDALTVGPIATQLALQHRYPPAIALLQSCLAHLAPAQAFERAGVLFDLGEFQRITGDLTNAKASYAQCRDLLEAALRSQPNNADCVSLLAMVYAGLGDKDAAMRQAKRAMELLPASKDALAGPFYEAVWAAVLARFGEKDAAIAALQHLLTVPSFNPITPALLRLDPNWDNLRDDPRFQKLIADKPLESTPAKP